MKNKNLTVDENSSFKNTIEKIELNKKGFILSVNKQNQVTGLLTDGDIRRLILKGTDINKSIKRYLNNDFVWADQFTSRETILKQLDHHIKFIPLLDNSRHLLDIISRKNIPRQSESPIFSRSRAPARVSFGGGGSDLTHFFRDNNGAVINSTISIYSHVTLFKRADSIVKIFSNDLDESIESNSLKEFLNSKNNFGLIQALLKTINPHFGFELFLNSDFPMKSGLGGSAVISSAILGCFNQFRSDKWDLHEIAELAFQAERLFLSISGGWQDQYASVFGGFNFIEFKMHQNIVHPLRIHPDIMLELEESLVLCDTGIIHDSGAIHDDQRSSMTKKDVKNLVSKNVELTYKIRNYLLRGRIENIGKSLDIAWNLKKQFSDKISNTNIDNIYSFALNAGALGGKLMGAGGGGFFIFFVKPQAKFSFIKSLKEKGLQVWPFRFDVEGLKSWTVRENK